DMAAQRLQRARGWRAAIEYTRTLPEVTALTESDPQALGVAPVENSDTGTVVPAQEALVRHSLTVLSEVCLRIQFDLVANVPLPSVTTVLAHPVAYEQCSGFLTRHLSGTRVSYTQSNMESGLKFLEGAGQALAAIVPHDFGQAHASLRAEENIQNDARNTTRFLAFRRRASQEAFDYTRGKMALYIQPAEDRPGLLFGLLSVFNGYHLNLCRLESRPDKTTPWNYVFFIDCNNNAGSARCVEELQRGPHRVTVLGSFDTVQ
ncbi:MAG TPA: prephenate dehydratase domain-containing protein, partial [bacterium]|nr:prephenate dehydratase domain-containing protein [bacterium]